MSYKEAPLHDDVEALLTSREGAASLTILLPFLRELALYIAGRSGREDPPVFDSVVPNLHSDARVERARCRLAGACR